MIQLPLNTASRFSWVMGHVLHQKLSESAPWPTFENGVLLEHSQAYVLYTVCGCFRPRQHSWRVVTETFMAYNPPKNLKEVLFGHLQNQFAYACLKLTFCNLRCFYLSYKDTRHAGLRAPPTLVWPHLKS